MPTALISLGANLGEKRHTLDTAVEMLRQTSGLNGVVVSTYRATPPVGGPEGQDEFLNAAARLETTLTARQLFFGLQQIEKTLGRQRQIHWGPRSIDLDLLLYGGESIRESDLQVPHRFLAFRKFVLEPAGEVAGQLQHPLLACSLQELADHARTTPEAFEFYGDSLPTGAVAQRAADELGLALSHAGDVYRISARGESLQPVKATFHLGAVQPRRGMPPWLNLPHNDAARAAAEAIAAIRSMRWNDADATPPDHSS